MTHFIVRLIQCSPGDLGWGGGACGSHSPLSTLHTISGQVGLQYVGAGVRKGIKMGIKMPPHPLFFELQSFFEVFV